MDVFLRTRRRSVSSRGLGTTLPVLSGASPSEASSPAGHKHQSHRVTPRRALAVGRETRLEIFNTPAPEGPSSRFNLALLDLGGLVCVARSQSARSARWPRTVRQAGVNLGVVTVGTQSPSGRCDDN